MRGREAGGLAIPRTAGSPALAPVWRRFGRTPVEYANPYDKLLAPTAVDLAAAPFDLALRKPPLLGFCTVHVSAREREVRPAARNSIKGDTDGENQGGPCWARKIYSSCRVIWTWAKYLGSIWEKSEK